VVGWVAFALSLAALVNGIGVWVTRGRRVWGRIGETLIAAASLGFCWFVLAFHLISFTYHY
jgi:hypothetical protein